jgi:hypothetical protein
MTNYEIRMTKECSNFRMTNDAGLVIESLVILSSLVLSHSSFTRAARFRG